MAKNTPANSGDPGSILGQEDPLEREMTTHSSILAWEILWTGEPGGLYSTGWKTTTTRPTSALRSQGKLDSACQRK